MFVVSYANKIALSQALKVGMWTYLRAVILSSIPKKQGQFWYQLKVERQRISGGYELNLELFEEVESRLLG